MRSSLAVRGVALFAWLLVSGAEAQSLPTAAAGPAPEGTSAELTASADYLRGNSALFLLGGSGYLRHRQAEHAAALFLSAGYAEAKSQRLLNALRVLGRYRYGVLTVLEGVGVEVFSHFERSEQRRHLALFELGAGPYVAWSQSERFSFTTTVGYAFELEKFSHLTDPNDADVLRDARGRPKARGRPLTDSASS